MAGKQPHHHTLRRDLTRTVLIWSGFFFLSLGVAYFLTVNDLVESILSDLFSDRMQYQTQEFAKHLSENHQDMILEESAALVQNRSIAGIVLIAENGALASVTLKPSISPALQITQEMSYEKLLRYVGQQSHLKLLEDKISGTSMRLALLLDTRPTFHAVHTATTWTTILLLLLVGISIFALHYSLRHHLIGPIDEMRTLIINNMPPEKKESLMTHLPDEVAELAHSYEHLIAERQFIESELRRAQKMEALDTLIGGIAHNINNILAGMTGNLYMARILSKDNAQLQAKIDHVEDLAFGAADIIKQLLTFARQNAATQEVLDLPDLIRKTIELHKLSAPKGMHLEYEITNRKLFLKADAAQLQQALLNLLINAFDATEHTERPLIHIKLEQLHADAAFLAEHRTLQGKVFAHLCISDNGCGIPAENIEHIFDPFFTTKEIGKGTGLGLSMVYGSISEHGGVIDVHSDKRGTRFDIYLPVLANIAVSTEPGKGGAERPVAGHGEMILLIDDEPVVAETTQAILETLNYRVLTASSGMQGIETYKQHSDQIALVILDIVMPVLGGPDTAKAIRSLDADARILFISGYDSGTTKAADIEEIGPIVNKPYTIEDLSRVVRTVIEKT